MDNNQAIFDTVVNHLRKQKVQSLDDEGRCVYRGNNGAMCAVGCLIKDEFYDKKIEHLPVRNPDVVSALVKSGLVINHNTIGLLGDLQYIHDSEGIDMEEKFKQYAGHYGLTYSEPEKV